MSEGNQKETPSNRIPIKRSFKKDANHTISDIDSDSDGGLINHYLIVIIQLIGCNTRNPGITVY